ncbi:glycosyltransferase family 9 protein [Helicobacter canis]|nr:glycosyltransferase family 9 protein [Helicobacter canis]
MSTPCIEMLFTQLPTARLCLIAPKSILELFSADSRIYACFEDSTKQAKNRLKATWQLGRAIRARLECDGGIDIGITLTNHFYSALLLFAAGARVRVGYKRGLGNVFLTHKLGRVGGIHQVESYVRLIDLALLGGDSALRDKSGISSPRCVDRHSSLISLRGLKNPNFSSQILESRSGITEQAQPLESTFEKSQKMDCHAVQAPLAMTEKEAENKKVDSRKNAQSVFDNHAAGGRISLKEHQQCQSDSSPQAESPKQNEDFGESTTHIPPLKLHTKPLDSSKSRKHLRIGLNPGAAYGSAKCWDKEHYACVGAYFAAMGAEVVIYGVEADRQLAEWIIKEIDFILGDSALRDKSWISSPLDRHLSLISLRGLKTSEAVQGEAEAGFFSKNPTFSSQSVASLENKQGAVSLEILESRSGITEQAQPLESTFENNANKTPKVDSRKNAQSVFDSDSQAAGFCDDFLKKLRFVGCARRAVGEGIYLSGNEQAHRADSRKSAQNKRSGASVSSQVSLEKPTPKTPKIINACGQTTIPTLLQALQALDLFITNDSGSMHIAAALGVPMVAIFGPTNMLETAPWRARDCALLNLNLPCAPCKKRVCPLGHHKCMKDLRPEMVIEAALAILHKPKLSK